MNQGWSVIVLRYLKITWLVLVNCILFALDFIILPIPFLVLVLLASLIPVRSWREEAYRQLSHIIVLWFYLTVKIMRISNPHNIFVQPMRKLDPTRWYLLLCNHVSWADILVIWCAFQGKIPQTRFFMKKSLLLTLPVLSWVCWFAYFPFVGRQRKIRTRRGQFRYPDLEKLRQATRGLLLMPFTIIIFPEGTRFSEKKHRRLSAPACHNLLPPRAGGAAMVLAELDGSIEKIIDVTITYSTDDPSLFKFLTGQIEKITVNYQLLPVTRDLIGNQLEDAQFRDHFQEWLNERWRKKDDKIDKIKDLGEKT